MSYCSMAYEYRVVKSYDIRLLDSSNMCISGMSNLA